MRDTKKWTNEECDFIMNNYTDYSDEELSQQLNRTFRSVKTKRQRLGCFRYFQESCEEIKGEKWTEYKNAFVSNKGRVKNKNGKFLKPYIHKTGYVYININGSFELLHRVIYIAFVGLIPNGFELDHKNCNKLNNALYNLELVTHSENMRRAYRNGCFTNFFGREPLTTIPQGSTPKQVEVPSTVACNDDGEDIV